MERKILIAVPTDDRMYAETSYSLRYLINPEGYKSAQMILQSSLIHASRDKFALTAIEQGCEYVLFVDSDMIFNRDALVRLFEHQDDIVSGLYFQRRNNHDPVIYTKVKPKTWYRKHPEMDVITQIDDPYIEVEACGMGFCLIKTEVFEKVFKRFGKMFEPFGGMGEDISFLFRARKCGYKVRCDTTVELGHIGTYVYTRKDWKK